MSQSNYLNDRAQNLYNLIALYGKTPLDTTPNVWTHLGNILSENGKTEYEIWCAHSAKGNVGFMFKLAEKEKAK